MEPPTTSQRIRFGVFELDPVSGELFKRGVRVRLQEQPFQALRALVARPGEVVTRQELQDLLWPENTYGDLEDGLSTALRKVRSALGDSASNPRFIETLPKRGYRFIAPVEKPLGANEAIPSHAAAPEPQLSRKLWFAGAAALAFAALAGWFVWPRQEPRPLLVPVPLTSLPGAETHPTFSPDGSQVAFVWAGEGGENLDLYLMTVDGGARSRLTSDPAEDLAPTWSPDGTSIAFVRRRGGTANDEVWLVSPLGGAERKIAEFRTRWYSQVLSLAWSLDGETLALSHLPDRSSGEQIHLLSTKTRALVPLEPGRVSAASEHELQPAFSPDGGALAFVRSQPYSRADILVSEPVGAPVRVVASFDDQVGSLTWTPDGAEVVFSSRNGVFRLSKRGGDPDPIPELGRSVGFFATSAHSSRMVYATLEENLYHLWRIDLGSNGVTESRPIALSTRSDAHGQISPDGMRIAFRSKRTGNPEIWVADANGSNPRRLTFLNMPAGGTPRWSPAGEPRIAFNSPVDNGLEIFSVPPSGGPPKRLTTEPGVDARPAWSYDGNWIYFQRVLDRESDCWRVSSDGEVVERLTSNGCTNPKISPDGRTLYFTRPRTERVYVMDIETGSQSHLFDLTSADVGGCLEALEDGLYYVTERRNDHVLFRRDYQTGASAEVAILEYAYGPVSCFSLAPDRSWLIYQRLDPPESDLMLVENFR